MLTLAPDDGQWGADMFIGHAIGCNAVSWAPAVAPGSLIAPQPAGEAAASTQGVKRFASAGCDNLVKIWGYREDSQSWVEEEVLEGHTDWVRDVAWAPNIGLPRSYIATASQVSASAMCGAPGTSCIVAVTVAAGCMRRVRCVECCRRFRRPAPAMMGQAGLCRARFRRSCS